MTTPAPEGFDGSIIARVEELLAKAKRLQSSSRELRSRNREIESKTRERDRLRHRLLELLLERAARLRFEMSRIVEAHSMQHSQRDECPLKVADVSCAMKWIPPGSCIVDGHRPSRREATVRDGFWMLEHPVTQALHQTVMGRNPSLFQHHGRPPTIAWREDPPALLAAGEPWRRRPVEQVSWFDAVEFCNALTRAVAAADPSLGLTTCYVIEDEVRDDAGIHWANVTSVPGASGFRLPTETEWEYACRGASDVARAVDTSSEETLANRCEWHADVDRVAWHAGNSGRRTQCVGRKAANPLGLFDMLGNVWEWCDDRVNCGATTLDSAASPQCRNARGGGFYTSEALHSGASLRLHASYFREDVGFRVVRSPGRMELLNQVVGSLQSWDGFCSEFADVLAHFEASDREGGPERQP